MRNALREIEGTNSVSSIEKERETEKAIPPELSGWGKWLLKGTAVHWDLGRGRLSDRKMACLDRDCSKTEPTQGTPVFCAF